LRYAGQTLTSETVLAGDPIWVNMCFIYYKRLPDSDFTTRRTVRYFLCYPITTALASYGNSLYIYY
jgi:hypothetical protein